MSHRGRVVVDGALQYTSTSQIERAERCPRSWWFRYVVGLKEPERPSMAYGAEGHRQISEYLLGGPRPTRPDVLRGMHMIPSPGTRDDLMIEHEFEHTVAGLPLVGKIDLVSKRGDNLGGDSLIPDGHLEIVDWKFASSSRYLPEPADLAGNIQLAEYARWLLDSGEAIPYSPIRLSLGYFIASPASARKISVVVQREDLEPTWKRSEVAVRQCVELAAVAEERDAPANTAACDRYGGCYYRAHCVAARHDPLTKLLGDTMGLLDSLNSLRSAAPSADAAAKLAAEERRAALGGEVIAACDYYEACPRGRPRLTGAAAQAWAAYKREVVDPQVGYSGTGELGALPGAITTVEHLVQVARELGMPAGAVADDARAQLAAQAHPASVSPPDAPTSDPPAPTVEAEARKTRKRGEKATPSTGAPALLAAVELPLATPEQVAEVQRAMGLTRVQTLAPTITTAAVSAPAAPVATPPTQPAEHGPLARVVGVNVSAHRHDLGAQELRPWVDQLLRDVADATGEAGDPRLPDDGPMAYGRWRVAVETLAQYQELGPGLWLVDCHAGDALTEAALRGLARRRDLVLLRGRA